MYRFTLSWPRHCLEMSGLLHASVALPLGKIPRYPLDRRLGGPQSRSRWRGAEKIWPYWDSNSDPSVQPVASRYTDYDHPAHSPLRVTNRIGEHKILPLHVSAATVNISSTVNPPLHQHQGLTTATHWLAGAAFNTSSCGYSPCQ
jgi:hypothetical protein